MNDEKQWQMLEKVLDKFGEKLTGEITEKVTQKVTEKVTEKEKMVLELLMEDPGFTTSYIAEKLSLNRKTVSLRIKSLKEKGVIVRVGSDKKGYWKIIK